MTICRLNDLSEGDEADVVRLEFAGSIRRRLQDIGLVPGNAVKCLLEVLSEILLPMIYAERLSQYAKKRRQKYMCRKVRKMGLTNTSTGLYAKDSGLVIKKRNYDDKVIALAGNPNVGKKYFV